MQPRPGEKKENARLSRRVQWGIGLVLLLLVIGLTVYLVQRDSHFPRTDPNIGKETGVSIKGTVTCNGQLMPGGYVAAYQGGPPVTAEVGRDGTYFMAKAPLGKCILTYSDRPPNSGPFRPPPKDEAFGPDGPIGKDAGPPKDRGGPPKDRDGLPKDKGGPPKNKGGAAKDKISPQDLPPKKKGGLGGRGGPPEEELSPLTAEQLQLIEEAGKKYRKPLSKYFEVETKKGINSKDLSLSIP